MPELYTSEEGKGKTPNLEKLLKKASRSHWSSFVACPKNIKFESQHDSEEVVIFGRAHFIVNLGWIAVLCFAVFIPMFWGSFPFFQVLNPATLLQLDLLWYMVLAFYGIQSFLLWFYNVYIVTSERLLDVDFVGLLNKTINVTQLSNIEDVNYTQKGIMQSMFDYGDVIVQTASEQNTPDMAGEPSAFTFESIANPDKVVSVISELIKDEDRKN